MRKPILTFLISIIAIVATAQVQFTQKGLKYTVLDSNSVKVGKIDDKHKPKGKLVIPAQVKHEGVTYDVIALDGWAFFGCEGMTEVVMPSTLTKIDIWAFCNCKKLNNVTIPPSVVEIGYCAFENCESFTTFTFPDGIKTVPDRLLQECINLKEVNVPSSVTSIGSSSFSSCKSLESITIPESVEHLGSYSFAYCDNLKRITLPKQLQSIGNEAFSCCKSLTEIVIPEGVTTIGSKLFNYCSALEKVTIPSTLTSLDGNPFSSCKALNEFNVADGNNAYIVKDGILFSKDMTQLIACPVKKELGDYIVPASVKEIAAYAFYDCEQLMSIKMTGVTRIGPSAFYGCNKLASVDFGDKLEYMGKGAFYSNNLIENIVLPDSFKHMDMINFEFCPNLKTVSVSEELSKREKDFNNLSFNFNSRDLRFIIRMPDGTTKTLTHDEINDVKKYFHNR